MKKLISLVLALALCCMMIPAMAESDSLAGVWYIGHGTINGEPVVVFDPEAVTITLLEDGTGILAAMAVGQQIDCKWTYADGKLTLSAEGQNDIECQVVDGEIALVQDAMEFYMTRTPDDTPVDLPGSLVAESADAFDGTWVPSKVVMWGLMVDAASAVSGTASIANLQIEGGNVSFVMEGSDPEPQDFSFDNGVLTSVQDAVVYKVTSTLTLLEDGSMMYSVLTEAMGQSMPTTFFYVKAE